MKFYILITVIKINIDNNKNHINFLLACSKSAKLQSLL